MSAPHSPQVAFVLSGGAGLGAIQVGMLQALYEREIAPDLIVGTSAGALNGAFIASRPQTIETAGSLAEIWRGVRRGQVFPLHPLTGLLGFLGTRDHLVPDAGMRRLIGRHVERERLEQMPIPLHVVAVDVMNGEEVRLSHGPTVEAVLASAAIPAVLPPVAWGDRMLMDGGVANNTPISHAVQLGARRIYVLPTGHSCTLAEPPSGSLGMALHAITLLMHQRLMADIERHRDDAELIVLPPPCPSSIAPTDFDHADELMHQACRDARRVLGSGEATRPLIHTRANRRRQQVRTRRHAALNTHERPANHARERRQPGC
jgi:NTE family protein